MAYNPAQARISGRFSGPGSQTTAAPAPRPTPAALAEAKATLARQASLSKTRAAVRKHQTPVQRQQAREYALAQKITARDKRRSLAKVHAAQRALAHRQAAGRRTAAGHVSAVAAGAAAGQRAPEGRRAMAPPKLRASTTNPGQVQARLRQYLAHP